MKYIGVFLLCLAAALFSREKIRIIEKRRCELLFFTELIGHIRREVSFFAKPLRKACEGFCSDYAVCDGFLSAVSEGGELGVAYESVRKTLSLSEDEQELVHNIFLSLGSSCLEENVKKLEAAEEELTRLSEAFGAEAKKRIKLVETLTATLSVGVIIAVI